MTAMHKGGDCPIHWNTLTCSFVVTFGLKYCVSGCFFKFQVIEEFCHKRSMYASSSVFLY